MTTAPAFPLTRISHVDLLPRPLALAVVVGVVLTHMLLAGWCLLAWTSPAVHVGPVPLFVSLIPGGSGSHSSSGEVGTGSARVISQRDDTGRQSQHSEGKRLSMPVDDQAQEQRTPKPDSEKTNTEVTETQTASLSAPPLTQTSSTTGAPERGNGDAGGNKTGDHSRAGAGSGMGAGSGTGSGAGEAGATSVTLSELRYRKVQKPEYPRQSRERYESGTVWVRVVVGMVGYVRETRVSQSSGYPRLDSAAMLAAKRSIFYPYTRNGASRIAIAMIPYHFSLTAADGR
ncbi:MAG: energy transducer TonB [Burkholderiaceae bacterium]|jgi:protein TonB|nr:energy transducer TonB [Burkholderiaceae bacterium]